MIDVIITVVVMIDFIITVVVVRKHASRHQVVARCVYLTLYNPFKRAGGCSDATVHAVRVIAL